MAARILVADDSVTIQKVVELTLSKEDFVLVRARSGEEAIRKAKEERPDLVLLDLVMPDKNGYEVCAALREDATLRGVPILLLTGTFEAFDKEKGIQAGANDFVTKPFESQVLVSKVKQLLFAKTVDVTPTAAPMGPSKAAPPKEAPRPAPAAPAPPAGPPHPAPGGVAPVVMPGGVPPSPAATPPRGTGVVSSPPPVSAEPAPPPPGAPPRAGRTLDLSPPSEEISQDRVRSVVEPPAGPPPSPTSGGFGGLNLKGLTSPPLPEAPGRAGDLHLELEEAASGRAPVPEEPWLEMRPLAPEPAKKKEAPPTPEVGAAALPKSLSLEELLSPEPTGTPPTSEPAPTRLEEEPGEPVFDLTNEMGGPSLPLVEVGTGEPPVLSIEDLLGSAGAVPPPPAEAPALELSAPGPEAAPEEPAGEPVFDLNSAQETALSGADMMGLREIEFEPSSIPPAEEGPAAPAAVPPLDIEGLVEVPFTEEERVDFEAVLTGGKAPVPPQVVPPQVVPPAVVAPPEVAAAPPIVPTVPTVDAVPPVAPATPSPGGAEAVMPEMAVMHQAVTERVAHELARDLSEKLLERIERIVWEVVPDLAEILITKEIERIRSQAEGKQSS